MAAVVSLRGCSEQWQFKKRLVIWFESLVILPFDKFSCLSEVLSGTFLNNLDRSVLTHDGFVISSM